MARRGEPRRGVFRRIGRVAPRTGRRGEARAAAWILQGCAALVDGPVWGVVHSQPAGARVSAGSLCHLHLSGRVAREGAAFDQAACARHPFLRARARANRGPLGRRRRNRGPFLRPRASVCARSGHLRKSVGVRVAVHGADTGRRRDVGGVAAGSREGRGPGFFMFSSFRDASNPCHPSERCGWCGRPAAPARGVRAATRKTPRSVQRRRARSA